MQIVTVSNRIKTYRRAAERIAQSGDALCCSAVKCLRCLVLRPVIKYQHFSQVWAQDCAKGFVRRVG